MFSLEMIPFYMYPEFTTNRIRFLSRYFPSKRADSGKIPLICGENNEIEYAPAANHSENLGKMAKKSSKSAFILRLVTASLG
jgi:hypothetical protein